AIEDVTAHVAQRAGAELRPRPPAKGMQPVVVIAHAGRAEPLLPVQALRDRLAGGTIALAAQVPGHETVRLGHGTDGASPDVLAQQPVTCSTVPLVTHLRGDLVLARLLGQLPGLVQTPRQRLLAEDVLAELDGTDGGRRMMVVWRGDQ